MAQEPVNISANIKNEEDGTTLKRTCTVDFDFGATLEESVEMYGADTVHRLFVQKARISIQDAGRAILSDVNKDENDVRTAIDSFTFEGGTRRKSKVDKLVSAVSQLSDEEKRAILAQLGL